MTYKKNLYIKNNKVYLKKKTSIKDYFIEIKKIIEKSKIKKKLVIDVACASGDFISYLRKNRNLEIEGLDYSSKLLKIAKLKNPNLKFYKRDLNQNINLKKKFDIVTCLGTMTAFDNWEKPLSNLFKLCKKSGTILLYDPINIYNINTLLRYEKNGKWISGFNLFSKKRIFNLIKKNNKNAKIKFRRFYLKTFLKKTNDSMRAWTIRLNKKNRIMVGTSQILDFHIIEIKNV